MFPRHLDAFAPVKALAPAALALLVTLAPATAEVCDPGRVDLRGAFGTTGFTVEIADTIPERSQGLMNRPSMPHDAGMLFVYDNPQPVSFWMENTLIPLDMLFVDRRGVVTRIHENAVPLDRTPIPGGDAVLAVLEINGGLAREIGIRIGDALRHPAIGPDAVWPCEE